VTAATLAKFGHDVVGYDDDSRKIETLWAGQAPFFEPGLQELLDETIESGRLRFVDQPGRAIQGAAIAFICVGTPARADGEANLVAVEQVAETIGRFATGDMVVVQKSTVPVHTGDRLARVFSRSSSHEFHVVSNPEFLREGSAVADSLEPARVLVGAEDDEAHRIMRDLYAPLFEQGVVYHATDLRTAELAKHACNAFLALKISFANALAQICEAAGANVVSIADIMGADPRIGREFLDAGLGYGGYCFPKDLAAFRRKAADLGYDFTLLDEIVKINEQALDSAFAKIKEAVWNLEGKRIVLLGLAFKPGTDDVRESPALRLARKLMDAGALVVGHDPQASETAKAEIEDLEISDDPYLAAEGAHCLVVCTEWKEFKELDLARLKGIMNGANIVDGRNLFDPDAVARAGFVYLSVGRPAINL
jgi:UDPglucose 6-dehydrogenase